MVTEKESTIMGQKKKKKKKERNEKKGKEHEIIGDTKC
jgi:hypothetical protein